MIRFFFSWLRIVLVLPLVLAWTYSARIVVGNIPLTLLDSVLIISVGIGGGMAIARAGGNDWRRIIRDEPVIPALLGLFVIAGAVPVVLAGTLTVAGQWKSLILLPSLYTGVLWYWMRTRAVGRRFVIYSIGIGMAIVMVFALVGWFGQGLTYDGRLAFPYSSPNQLAMVVAPLLAGVVVAARFMSALLWRITGAGVAVGLAILLGATESLGAIVAVALAIISVASLRHQRHFVTVIVIVIVSTSIVALWIVPTIDGLFFSSLTRARAEIWRSAEILIREHGFVGIGFGAFQDRYLALQPLFSPYQEWAVPHPHQTALAGVLGAGIFGAGSFLALVGTALARAVSRPSPLLLAVSAAFLTALFHGMVDTTFFRNDLMVWSMAGMVLMTCTNYSRS